MSSVVIAGNTSGTITLDAPNVAGTTVLTLPTANGTVLTTANTFGAGTGPAFSAYMSANQTIPNATYTKLQINTETFDTNSNYDPTTNYRFTPTVAGYYQLNYSTNASSAASSTFAFAVLYKNGASIALAALATNNTSTGTVSTGSFLVSMNGSSDYLEIYGYQNTGGGLIFNNGANVTYFNGFLARSA
jgi:hypothetical protein